MLVALEVKLSPRAAHALDRDQYFSLGILVIKTTNCILRQFYKKNPARPLFLCTARAYCCGAVRLLPPMPFLGVSSLDLGRLRQRRRPLYLVYFTLMLVGIASRCSDTEIELLTYDVSCDKLLFGGKPLAADALFGRFLPRLGRLWQRQRPL
jgi:hypothetical protein